MAGLCSADEQRNVRQDDYASSHVKPFRLPVAPGSGGVRLVLSVAVFALILPLMACSDPCENQAIERIPSPDGDLTAILFARDCGASTGVSTHLALGHADMDTPAGPGNVFIAETGETGQAANWGGPWARAEWVTTAPWSEWPEIGASTRELVLTHDADARIFAQNALVEGVTIHFEAREVHPY